MSFGNPFKKGCLSVGLGCMVLGIFLFFQFSHLIINVISLIAYFSAVIVLELSRGALKLLVRSLKFPVEARPTANRLSQKVVEIGVHLKEGVSERKSGLMSQPGLEEEDPADSGSAMVSFTGRCNLI